MAEGFLMDLATAMVFYQVCKELNLNDKESRLKVLRLMVADKKATYLRDPQSYIKDKRILIIKQQAKKA